MPKIKYRCGYLYQLAETYKIQLTITPTEKTPSGISSVSFSREYLSLRSDGLLTIRKGYAWDGASGPTIDTKTIMRASLVHDAIYQLLREGAFYNPIGTESIRRYADDMLRHIAIEDGMNKIRAWWIYHAVRIAGGRYTLADAEQVEQGAP